MDFEILLMFFFSSLEMGKGKGKGKEKETPRRCRRRRRCRTLVGLLVDVLKCKIEIHDHVNLSGYQLCYIALKACLRFYLGFQTPQAFAVLQVACMLCATSTRWRRGMEGLEGSEGGRRIGGRDRGIWE